MTETIFPLGTLLLLYFVLIPLCSLLGMFILRHIQKKSSWQEFGSSSTYHILLFPTLLPILWLVSASVHLWAEYSHQMHLFAHHHLVSCLVEHTGFLTDEQLLLFLLLGGLGLSVFSTLFFSHRFLPSYRVVQDSFTQERLARICSSHPVLQQVSILLVEEWTECAGTTGVFYPKILLHRDWIQHIDDEMLKAVLLHEVAHIDHFDVLRSWLLLITKPFNCCWRFLQPSLLLWREARESVADAQAIRWGAEPLALAQAIIHSLRWKQSIHTPSSMPICTLYGEGETSAMQLRLMMLMNPSPEHSTQRTPALAYCAVCLWLFVLIVPHIASWDVLETLHYHIENTVLGINIL